MKSRLYMGTRYCVYPLKTTCHSRWFACHKRRYAGQSLSNTNAFLFALPLSFTTPIIRFSSTFLAFPLCLEFDVASW